MVQYNVGFSTLSITLNEPQKSLVYQITPTIYVESAHKKKLKDRYYHNANLTHMHEYKFAYIIYFYPFRWDEATITYTDTFCCNGH